MSDIIIIFGRKYKVLSRTNFDGCTMEEIEEYKESENYMVGQIVTIEGKKYKVVSDSSGDGLTIEPIENFIVKPKDRIEELEERVAKLEIKLANLVNALS
nr:MAG TPA: zipper dimerization domain transcription factor-like protein [Caudoviricetes sp.]